LLLWRWRPRPPDVISTLSLLKVRNPRSRLPSSFPRLHGTLLWTHGSDRNLANGPFFSLLIGIKLVPLSLPDALGILSLFPPPKAHDAWSGWPAHFLLVRAPDTFGEQLLKQNIPASACKPQFCLGLICGRIPGDLISLLRTITRSSFLESFPRHRLVVNRDTSHIVPNAPHSTPVTKHTSNTHTLHPLYKGPYQLGLFSKGLIIIFYFIPLWQCTLRLSRR